MRTRPFNADRSTETLRADRITLRRPRRQADGSWRYDGILAIAEVPMHYADRVEVATVEALSDPAYLESLRGISITTAKSAPHKTGRPIDTSRGDRAVGTVLDAKWLHADMCVKLDLVVHDAQTNRDIADKKITELSEGYFPSTRLREAGVYEQTKRVTNHVCIVEAGRCDGARLRADEEDAMTPEQIAAAIQAGLKENLRADALDAEKKRADDAEAALADEKKRADTAEAELAALRNSIGMQADSDDISSALESKVAEMVAADSALLEDARELGIELPEGSTPATRLKDIAVALGADALRADSADFARVYIDASKSARASRGPTAAERHASAGRKGRKDSPNDNHAAAPQRRV